MIEFQWKGCRVVIELSRGKPLAVTMAGRRQMFESCGYGLREKVREVLRNKSS